MVRGRAGRRGHEMAASDFYRKIRFKRSSALRLYWDYIVLFFLAIAALFLGGGRQRSDVSAASFNCFIHFGGLPRPRF
jgi:hypothetical protein